MSGSVYYGYMDMTYFSFFYETLKKRKLKIAIVFLHEEFRFEVWLSASNKSVQTEYLDMIRKSGWNRYNIATSTKGVDSILDYILIDNPDFSDLDSLTKEIERGVLNFTKAVENFLSNH